MKVDKGVSIWRIWGFYIQCFKELTFAKRTGNNCILVTDHFRLYKESLLSTREYLILNIKNKN